VLYRVVHGGTGVSWSTNGVQLESWWVEKNCVRRLE
jgi:hypothetical protein